VNARPIAPPVDSCVTAREDAAADPRLDVERVPTPVKMEPPPIRRPVPRNVLRRDGSAVIRVEVMVDTLGTPDMATFAVLERLVHERRQGRDREVDLRAGAPERVQGAAILPVQRYVAGASEALDWQRGGEGSGGRCQVKRLVRRCRRHPAPET
jgi:hypothetical protein